MEKQIATEQLLRILKSGVGGSENASERCALQADEALLKLSAKQKLLPVVMDVLHANANTEDGQRFVPYRQTARRQVMQQALRTRCFLDVYRVFSENGVSALVVKGCVCRALWPKEDLRVSTDEDVYVRDADFAKACALLRDCGLVCDERADPETDYEIGWRKPGTTLYLELHRRLYEPGSAAAELQRFFDDAFERAQEYAVEHGAAKVRSMSPEDHLLYLLLHAYKHFVNSGFGIRQVCDIGLWMKRYGKEIDPERFTEKLEEAHALYFAAAVFAIAREDLGIALQLPARWEALCVDREPMLQDLLDGGVYGCSSMSRLHSAALTAEAVRADRGKRRKAGLLRRAFPPRESLFWDYPELKEHPARLPIVWGKRLAKYRKETKTKPNNSLSESLRIAKEREALLKLYHII